MTLAGEDKKELSFARDKFATPRYQVEAKAVGNRSLNLRGKTADGDIHLEMHIRK